MRPEKIHDKEEKARVRKGTGTQTRAMIFLNLLMHILL